VSLSDLFAPGLLYVAVSRVRRHNDVRFIDLPERKGPEPVDFAAAELRKDVLVHVTKESEDIWKEKATRRRPDEDFGKAAEEDRQPIDADVAEEFYLPVDEEEDALLAEYDNDDFFL
jgi:hypothetical protein